MLGQKIITLADCAREKNSTFVEAFKCEKYIYGWARTEEKNNFLIETHGRCARKKYKRKLKLWFFFNFHDTDNFGRRFSENGFIITLRRLINVV